MAKFPKITINEIEFSFSVGTQPFRVIYHSNEKITRVYRKEPGTVGWIKVFQDGVPAVSLDTAMIVLKSCISVLKSQEQPENG